MDVNAEFFSIQKRIEAKGAWNPIAELELKAFWKHAILPIQWTGVQHTVVGFLRDVAPVQFFTAPASPSGKHHPPWQNQPYGMLRNTTECCLLIPGMSQYVPAFVGVDRKVDPKWIDLALAATIISDTFKFVADDKTIGAEHGSAAAANWLVYARRRRWMNEPDIEKVFDAVFWHYGIWTPQWRKEDDLARPLSPLAMLVHQVDAFFAQNALAKLYNPKGVIE